MDLTYPRWREPLAEAILEFDREKLREKVQKAEVATASRIEERHSRDNQLERLALIDGLSILQIVKKDRLGILEGKSE